MKKIKGFYIRLMVGACMLMSILSYHGNAQVIEQDSLALVALYQATGGPDWVDNTNWLQPGKPVSSWFGVGAFSNRVYKIVLNDNNLTGSIPEAFGNMTALQWFSLSNNHLSGTIPASIKNFDNANFLALYGNDYTGDVPAFFFDIDYDGIISRIVVLGNNRFTGIAPLSGPVRNLKTLDVTDNRLDFGDLEALIPQIQELMYTPQDTIYNASEVTVRENARLIIKAETPGTVNRYQWFKNEQPITGKTQKNLEIKITPADEGNYTAAVTNDIATDLTLYRDTLTVRVKEAEIFTSCTGTGLVLNAAIADPQATYVWSNGKTTPSIEVTTSGKYGVRIETVNYSIEDTLQAVIPAALSLGRDIDTCAPSVQLSPNINDADSYSWVTPQGNVSSQRMLQVTQNGRYVLEIRQQNCIQRDTLNVILNRFTTGDFTMHAGDALLENGSRVLSDVGVTFSNVTPGLNAITWSIDQNTFPGDALNYTFEKAGQYTITLQGTDSRNCPVTVQKIIQAENLVITNAISPDGDGKNDKLFIEPLLYEAELKIVNRWGLPVYESVSYADDFTGSNLESGVYYYEVYFKPIRKSFKGFIHILK